MLSHARGFGWEGAGLRGAEPRIPSSNRNAFENRPIVEGCRGKAADSAADAQCGHSSAGSPVSENRPYAWLMDRLHRIVLIRVMPDSPEVAFEEAVRQKFSFSSHASSCELACFQWPAHPHKRCEFSYPGLSPVNYNRSREIVVAAESRRAHCRFSSETFTAMCARITRMQRRPPACSARRVEARLRYLIRKI